ncbi:MAG: 30S ribosomal protein S4, partial [Erysipelotrichaceae bacterium]|nr:30S ribosomal protein S4 [Erysipelotrichaceae bacterium]
SVSTKDFVSVDKENKKGKFVRLPERNELNTEVNELLVIEYYNR